jgi:hypothetical protein
MSPSRVGACALALLFTTALPALAQENDAATALPFAEGDVITFQEVGQLERYLPPEFWAHRERFFFEGMRLEIGPSKRDYSEAPEYLAATDRYRGQARIGPGDSLESYTAGRPFPTDEIDCAGDPQAGAKLIWNFDYRWQGAGLDGHYMWSYWDNGKRLPLYYEAKAHVFQLSHRVDEPYLGEQEGNVFRGETRKWVRRIDVVGPFDVRGTAVLQYRYKSADRPAAEVEDDDQWIYVPQLRRVRRFTQFKRADAVSGTDFTFDDFASFFGIVPLFEWSCVGEAEVIAPVNGTANGFPLDEDRTFGPTGMSFADDRWELRSAFVVKMTPREPGYPYSRKILYIDRQTYEPLYSLAYDQKEALWKIIWHTLRWSGDHETAYPGWKGVPTPRDLYVVSDIIVNVQTGTGNRIEYWNNSGTPVSSRRKLRQLIEVSSLAQGH